MNRGLVVNSAPRARVWSPSLAMVLLVLLFRRFRRQAVLRYRGEPPFDNAPNRQRLKMANLMAGESESTKQLMQRSAESETL